MDIYTIGGAVAGNAALVTWGAIKSKQFNPVYLIDALLGSVIGAISPDLLASPPDGPAGARFLAGLLIGLGAKQFTRVLMKGGKK